MSIIVIDNQVVHYEVLGRGRPVVFLHGWLGSWRYWFPTMEVVAEHFRTYSFDFWGFGDSRRKQTRESIQAYSDQVIRFLDALGIDRAMLVGHSMGGMVALKTALSYPNRISRVATVGAPIDGDSLSWLLKLTDRPLFADAFARLPWLRRSLFRFFLGETSDPAISEMIDDSVKSSANTLRYAVSSMWRTDLRPELSRLRTPTLIVHGGRDDIVDPHQADLFEQSPLAEVVMMPRSRHFPFLDEAELFNDVLLRFLRAGGGAPPPNPLQPARVGSPLHL
ncbi:MAG: alpha/beta fold hydrolase [Oscillochloridaceae bacterium umkhey_bin13]